ncbi:MAG: hypothetical protein IKN43_03535 [Selenomonadaceae bacterium]|nr:hypothetical protein [Selenomonadaceae bacterium]
MKFEDTFNELENKMNEIGKLLDESIEASKEGNRFKAHGIAIDAEKVAKEFEELASSVTDKDIEEVLTADEEAEQEDMISFLRERAEILPKLVEEYATLSNGEDELAAYRKLREITQLGADIAHVTERNYD